MCSPVKAAKSCIQFSAEVFLSKAESDVGKNVASFLFTSNQNIFSDILLLETSHFFKVMVNSSIPLSLGQPSMSKQL